jgi:hypothetical protein
MPRTLVHHRTATSLLALLALIMAALMPLQAAGQDAGTPAATPGVATPAAQTGPRFVIYPQGGGDGDYFTLKAEAGTTNELVVILGNADDEPLELRTYASNVLPITNGGFAIGGEDVTPEDTTTWLDYPAETFAFASGEGIERTFTVTIPEDAAPGQYITGLALETAEPLEVEGTPLFQQVIRKTIAVFIIVPGEETPAFSLGEPEVAVEGAGPRIEIPVENTGNVYVRPEGELIVRDAAGETVLTAPIRMGSVYAGLTVPLSVPLTTPLPEGDYTVSAELVDEQTGVSASVTEAAITLVSAAELAAQVTVEGTVTLAPDPANPAFADVALTITNPGEPIANAEVILDVARDGEPVETFPLGPAFSLPQGETTLTQRYVPPTGWEAGTWTFTIRVNAIDPSTGTATTIATLDSLAPVTVGE